MKKQVTQVQKNKVMAKKLQYFTLVKYCNILRHPDFLFHNLPMFLICVCFYFAQCYKHIAAHISSNKYSCSYTNYTTSIILQIKVSTHDKYKGEKKSKKKKGTKQNKSYQWIDCRPA
jgi:hypothetical protein